MPRRRLGVVLLLPHRVAAEVDGLRRALGVADVGQIPPHITLVPPISVLHDEVDVAIAMTRQVANTEPTRIQLVLGPVATFHPINPVIYLAVGGPGLATVHAMRDALDSDVLEHVRPHEFVPHVTLNDIALPEQIDGALASLGSYIETVAIDAITVLEQGDDKIWRPIAEAPFGDGPRPRTFGADAVTVAVHSFPTTAGAAIGRYRPLVVEAFIEGRTAGIARGRVASGDLAWLDELVIVGESRGSGVGGALARAFIDAARTHGATELRASRGATIAGFLMALGLGQADTTEFVLAL